MLLALFSDDKNNVESHETSHSKSNNTPNATHIQTRLTYREFQELCSRPNLIGSYAGAFYKDSKSCLNSKMVISTKRGYIYPKQGRISSIISIVIIGKLGYVEWDLWGRV